MIAEQATITMNPVRASSPPARGMLQRACACGNHAPGGECAACKRKRLQRQATGENAANTAPPIVHDVLRSSGQPLDPATLAFMEPRLGRNFSLVPAQTATPHLSSMLTVGPVNDRYEREADRIATTLHQAPCAGRAIGSAPRVDFSRVRLHTSPRAAAAAASVDALAFTVGRDIVFGTGQYAPGTGAGQRLLAHELAHVAQQDHGRAVLRRQPARTAEAQWGIDHPGQISEVGKSVGEPSNEFAFWNYLVGAAELRQEHRKMLTDTIIPNWIALFSSRADLRIKIIGSASKSGGQAVARDLADRRAATLRAFLVANGIPSDRIEFTGVGSTEPLADETSSSAEIANENKARNRRVELFLFVPTTTVPTLGQSVQPQVIDFDARFTNTVLTTFNRNTNQFTDIGNRSSGNSVMLATAHVKIAGPPDSEIGFLQFLTEDIRLGVYHSRSNVLVLDYGRCTSPFLPCRDITEATEGFSAVGSGRSARPPTPDPVEIQLGDSPGTVFPIRVDEAGNPQGHRGSEFFLAETTWFMEFALVLGARNGASFMPLQHIIWSLESNRFNVNSGIARGTPSVKQVSRGTGMPRGLSADSAMSLRTCRFLARRIEGPSDTDVCRPSVSS